MDRMLHRTNPVGQADAGWMCMPCIEKNESELARNIKSEKDFNTVEDIGNIVMGKDGVRNGGV